MWKHRAFLLVSLVVIVISPEIFSNIFFGTGLTFIQMTVCHPRVFVEILKRLLKITFETEFSHRLKW